MTMNKKAIIIGASSGIGKAVAEELLSQGWTVGVAARREERLKEFEEHYPGRVEVMQMDVTAGDATERLDRLIEALGGMDLYFHAAGVGRQNRMLESSIEETTIRTNCVGFTRLVGHAFRYFTVKGGGQIGVISSIAGTKGIGVSASYSATKRFQNTYIESLQQLSSNRKLGIHLTDIRPGFVDTDLLEDDYPMKMKTETVAKKICRALEKKKAVATIDWKYRLLVFFWRLIPAPVWRRMVLIR